MKQEINRRQQTILEAEVQRLMEKYRTDKLPLHVLVSRMDMVVAAARLVVLRRIEREPLPFAVATLPRTTEDAGLHAINQTLREIARRAGLRVDFKLPEGEG